MQIVNRKLFDDRLVKQIVIVAVMKSIEQAIKKGEVQDFVDRNFQSIVKESIDDE